MIVSRGAAVAGDDEDVEEADEGVLVAFADAEEAHAEEEADVDPAFSVAFS